MNVITCAGNIEAASNAETSITQIAQQYIINAQVGLMHLAAHPTNRSHPVCQCRVIREWSAVQSKTAIPSAGA